MKAKKRIAAMVLAVLMAVGCVTVAALPDAQAVTQASINKLKNKSKDLQKEINGYQAQIDELNAQGAKTFAQKELLDEQCALITEEISYTEQQIVEYGELVAQAQLDYENAVAEEEAQYELMCERIRTMEERGTISYVEILFNASSFADLLGRIDFIDEVMRSDESVIFAWRERQQETLEYKADLEVLIEETEAVKVELEAQKAELEEKRAAAEALMLEIQANQEEYQALLDELEQEQGDLASQRAKAEAEYAEQIRRQQEAAAARNVSGSGNSAAGISLAWPVSSRRITDYFGPRSAESTNGIGSTNHMGIDIGAVGYTSTVSAAAAGVVTVATTSRSAGNYVAVSHGSGVVTYYMHLSSYCVSVGDSVSQGQKLGITGSTGNSTGPHLHFAVTISGSYVDPLKYLP